MTQRPRAAILARCSSEENVCNQVLSLKQYAADKYIVEEEDIYGDTIGGSSDISERVDLQRLMQNISEAKKDYKVVLVQDVKRLGRTPEQVEEIRSWFAARKVDLYFLEA